MNFCLSVPVFRFPFPTTPNTLVATRMGEAARQVRQTSPASACLHRGPTTKQNHSDPSNHAQTPRAEGSGIYFRSDCMRRSASTRRQPLRDAGRGAAPVVCVAGCFPALPALFAAAASSAIPLEFQFALLTEGSKELGIPPSERLKHEHRLIPQTS